MSADETKKMTFRFLLVYALLAVGFLFIIGKILIIQQIEGEKWVGIGNFQHSKERAEKPVRGSIYADDGNTLLVSSVPYYDLYIDMRIIPQKEFDKYVDTLSLCLSRLFQNKTKAEYKRYLSTGYRKKQAYYRLKGKGARFNISFAEYNRVIHFPLLRKKKGKISPLKVEKQMRRHTVYGGLGRAIIGKMDDETGEASTGLEAACDSFLAGEPGIEKRQRHAGKDLWIPRKKAQHGADVVATLNANMQDIAEKALLRKLTELDADSGCVMIMETATGEIKACVNLDRISKGSYNEDINFGLTGNYEPGSTFKIPALMAMIEEGKIHDMDSLIDCEEGEWLYYDVTITDAKRGGFGIIPIEQVIVRSSNIGMSKLVLQYYRENPQAFADALLRTGIGQRLDIGFGSAVAVPKIRGREDYRAAKESWSPVYLPYMSFGYSIYVPLLNTLTFYNAIANNGKMLAPCFVKQVRQNGETIKENQPRILQNQICSPSTLATIKDLLTKVVSDSLYGTGRQVKSNYVNIAGKSGTAQARDKVKNQVSFCGFFPVENPQYTCIVFIQIPRSETASGGAMAGAVFKEVAERIMTVDRKKTLDEYIQNNAAKRKNISMPGNVSQMKQIFKALQIDTEDETTDTEWATMDFDNISLARFTPLKINENTVPDFKGMNLQDALVIAQRAGFKIKAKGAGKVTKQTQNGKTIELILE